MSREEKVSGLFRGVSGLQALWDSFDRNDRKCYSILLIVNVGRGGVSEEVQKKEIVNQKDNQHNIVVIYGHSSKALRQHGGKIPIRSCGEKK